MRSILIIPLALLAVSCIDMDSFRPTPLPVERLTPPYRDTYSRLVEPARLVIRDEQSFADVWTRAYGAETPRPRVDFDRDVVIVVAMGEQRSGGYSIDVDGVNEFGGRVIVDVAVGSFGKGCAVTMALTQPNDIVKVARHEGVTTFADRAVRHDCDR